MRSFDAITTGLLALGVLGVWVQAEPASKTLEIDELTVKRINVVEEDGRRRIVLSNAERFPLPVLGGKQWPRSINPAGVVFYKSDGDECGGIGLAEVGTTRKNMLLFDYANSEGVGIGVTETAKGYSSAGLSIAERLPDGSDIATVGTTGPERVSIANDNGTAQVVLSDAAGKPRLRLAVERDGAATIEFLGEDGSVVERLPR